MTPRTPHRRLILAAVSLVAVAAAAPVLAQDLSPQESAAVTGETLPTDTLHCPIPKDVTVDAPPAAHPGQCFARVRIAPTYETYSERVLAAPGRREQRTIAAVYEWAERRVLVEPARIEHRVIPATYRTITETVVVTAATTRVEHIEAVYDTVTERVVSRPAHSEWRRTFVGPDGVIPVGAEVQPTGEMICLIEVPAEYSMVERRVLREAGHDVEVRAPAVTREVTRQVVDRPERVEDIPVAAVYRTEKYRRVVTEARTEWIDVPPVYTTREARRQTSAGRLEWREVKCDPKRLGID
jgi:hypothetical protein